MPAWNYVMLLVRTIAMPHMAAMSFCHSSVNWAPKMVKFGRIPLSGFGIELSAEDARALFIPEGVAHGFLTLQPDTDVLYQISPKFEPGHEAGVRWNDPAFAIAWPHAPALISERDATYPDWRG